MSSPSDPSRDEGNALRTPSHWTRLSSLSHSLLPDSWAPLNEVFHDGNNGIHYNWNSRAHRKGIPAIPATPKDDEANGGSHGKEWTVKRQRIRWVGFDYFDISWWVAIIFVVGSIFWCVNGVLAFCFFTRTTLPYTNTESATAFLGGFTFIVGAYLGWVESLNPSQDADFGWEIDELTHTLIEPSHHHNSLGRKRRHFGKHQFPSPSSPENDDPTKKDPTPATENSAPAAPPQDSNNSELTLSNSKNPEETPRWRWYGTSKSLAYVANTIQLFGASIFFLSVLCGLPGILPLSGGAGGPEQQGKSEGLWVGLYWVCQVIGAPCFVIAGAMFCLEVQKHWWLPNVFNLGWQIGFWNLIGGFGFWFCGIFGIWRQTSIENPLLYQKWGTAFSTFWGSWAFLIGSYLQLWEGINKRQ